MSIKLTTMATSSIAVMSFVFGASASHAATLSPSVEVAKNFGSNKIVSDNNNNNYPHIMDAAAKPAMLAMLA